MGICGSDSSSNKHHKINNLGSNNQVNKSGNNEVMKEEKPSSYNLTNKNAPTKLAKQYPCGKSLLIKRIEGYATYFII